MSASESSFPSKFPADELLRKCRAYKAKGGPAIQIFPNLLCCMFSQASTYMSMRKAAYSR